ncbi:MAG: right-handed parallel beta-helix repeat-containing protein [Ignavibacteriales bacterium]|nr:right-handed parallel beta-helix repeat-containing protein [Ignavibacteriales bacterium]
MKDLLIRSVLFFAVIALFIAANYNNTNSNLLGDNNSVPPPPIAKYVTPHGAGDYSGSSWTNAYSIEDLKHRLASFTSFYFTDSTYLIDSFVVRNFVNISFIGKSKANTIFEGILPEDKEDTSNWSMRCFELVNTNFCVIKDLQIRRFRAYGIKTDSYSNYFTGDNIYVDSCGWAAWGNSPYGSPLPIQMNPFPAGIKLFGDYGTLRNSTVQRTGWDGVQVAGYNVLIESSSIDSTGIDLPGAEHQGDWIHVFRNPDIYYEQENGLRIYKAGRLTVNNCYINTNSQKKSGIEAGFIEGAVEKPRLRAYNSYIAGGKGIGITQSNDLTNGEFYSDVQNCTIVSLDPTRRPLRIEFYDTGTNGLINNNIMICHPDFNPDLCPVGEYDTAPTAVKYGTNTWKIGTEWQDPFCIDHNLDYVED